MSIKMKFNGKELTFNVTYQCPEYVFCECPAEPSARGFFTQKYLSENTLS